MVTANVTWQAAPPGSSPIVGYMVQLMVGTVPAMHAQPEIDVGNALQHEFIELAENQDVGFRVRAYDQNGLFGPFTSWSTFVTPQSETPPGVPTDVLVTFTLN